MTVQFGTAVRTNAACRQLFASLQTTLAYYRSPCGSAQAWQDGVNDGQDDECRGKRGHELLLRRLQASCKRFKAQS